MSDDEQRTAHRWREFGNFVNDSCSDGFLGREPQVVMVEMAPMLLGQTRSFAQDCLSPTILNRQNFCRYSQISGICRLGIVSGPVNHERCVCTGFSLRRTEVG